MPRTQSSACRLADDSVVARLSEIECRNLCGGGTDRHQHGSVDRVRIQFPTTSRRSARRRNDDALTEAIVSSHDRRRMKGAAPAVHGAAVGSRLKRERRPHGSCRGKAVAGARDAWRVLRVARTFAGGVLHNMGARHDMLAINRERRANASQPKYGRQHARSPTSEPTTAYPKSAAMRQSARPVATTTP